MNRLMLFLFWGSFVLGLPVLAAQGVAELEQQLRTATSAEARVALNTKLAELTLASDPRKALEYAKAAHRSATDSGNKALAATTAIQVAQVYEKIKDERNQEVWLKSAFVYAKEAKDLKLLVTSVEKRSKLATRDQNYRRAYEINQEALQFLTNQVGSIGALEADYASQRANLENEKRRLQQTIAQLEGDIDLLANERNQVTDDKAQLETQQVELVTQNQRARVEISKKIEDLDSLSASKKIVEAQVREKEEAVANLSREKLEQQFLLVEARNKLMQEQLKVEERQNLLRLGAALLGFTLLLVLLLYNRYRVKRRSAKALAEQNTVIASERARSDELLLNILPESIAQELKTAGKARARRFEQVSVLFTDFVNFTRISEQLSPEELVEELDKCFKAFDFIIGQYPDIEKIKTIGDAYMCASGLSDRRTMPYGLVQAALDIQGYLAEYRELRIRQGKPFFEARLGIHTGPVVAGVVGSKKFVYDIWGDTVNIAARVEANCEPGQINISEETYRLVKYRFECQPRGRVQAKNKGELEMYYVKKALNAATVA